TRAGSRAVVPAGFHRLRPGPSRADAEPGNDSARDCARALLLYRSFTLRTNLSPDHTAFTAATFTSTRPCASPIARIPSSVRSVVTPDAFLGHEIHNIPAGASARSSAGNRRSSSP